MSVSNLLAPRQGWTDLDVNSLTTDELNVTNLQAENINAIKIASEYSFNYNVLVLSSSGSIILSAESFINSFIFINGGGTASTVTIPSAASLGALLVSQNLKSSFKFTIINNGGEFCDFSLGAGITQLIASPAITISSDGKGHEFVLFGDSTGMKLFEIA